MIDRDDGSAWVVVGEAPLHIRLAGNPDVTMAEGWLLLKQFLFCVRYDDARLEAASLSVGEESDWVGPGQSFAGTDDDDAAK